MANVRGHPYISWRSEGGVCPKCQLTVSRGEGGLIKLSADCQQGGRKLPNLASADIWMTPYRHAWQCGLWRIWSAEDDVTKLTMGEGSMRTELWQLMCLDSRLSRQLKEIICTWFCFKNPHTHEQVCRDTDEFNTCQQNVKGRRKKCSRVRQLQTAFTYYWV